uniref:Uncharacterized protein n=1 Tax=Physcomitrium patens TaxID=3218 RepID=A0A2K1KME6_PHYPA|nr:hypothetical protein PHYPA_005842 [Physcomitrium patens]
MRRLPPPPPHPLAGLRSGLQSVAAVEHYALTFLQDYSTILFSWTTTNRKISTVTLLSFVDQREGSVGAATLPTRRLRSSSPRVQVREGMCTCKIYNCNV